MYLVLCRLHYILGENIYVYRISQERHVPLKASKETGLKLNMDIAKHILHELHTEIKSALIDWKCFQIYICEHFLSLQPKFWNWNQISFPTGNIYVWLLSLHCHPSYLAAVTAKPSLQWHLFSFSQIQHAAVTQVLYLSGQVYLRHINISVGTLH